jgi:DNA-directed RNA polymerase subunit M/transcription elongation factor TFIIS
METTLPSGVTKVRARCLREFAKTLPLQAAWQLERDLFVWSVENLWEDGHLTYTFRAVTLLDQLAKHGEASLHGKNLSQRATDPVSDVSHAQVTLAWLQQVTLDVPKDIQGGMRCFKCGSIDLLVEMHQTRAADEGMTQFVTCKGCGSKW